MRQVKTTTATVVIALAIGFLFSLIAEAKKPGRGGGGDGGTEYQIQPLDTVEGLATDIHRHDGTIEIVGISYADASAVYWVLNSAGDVVLSVDLNASPGQASGAEGLNRSGAVAGWQHTAGVDNSLRPLVWRDLASDPVQLPVPNGFVGSAKASSVNDNLLVVGNLTSDNGQRSIVAWQLAEVEGALITLDAITVATGTQSGLAHVNNQGFVAATLDNRAFRWRVNWNPELGETGGLDVISEEQLFDVFSTAADINEAGTVCGEVTVFGGGHEAYAKTLNGDLLDLPLLNVNSRKQRTENVAAMAINDAGQVVGTADVISQRTNVVQSKPAVLWNVGEGALELPLQNLGRRPVCAG